ncbi:invasion associated locus B family protein [Sinorhizobium sp. 7-81]|uniref:invasion associated locus B family protein n=1 Tax=Sinorhizobium sp. 8-89 TaxID=3049089 RepID=UPI0024C384F5|nr:invasion associated locus B family protein [Sinorhizobium sp. 8-89]MDK1494026.1 invasion associated locus B family protein [Sinorhizobium sp. 8-89]
MDGTANCELQIDEEQSLTPLRFATCLPAACLVPLSFDAKTVAALRTGKALKINVQGVDKKEVGLSVALKGLAAALDRLEVLAGA